MTVVRLSHKSNRSGGDERRAEVGGLLKCI